MFLRLLPNLMLFGFVLVIAQNPVTLTDREWQLVSFGPAGAQAPLLEGTTVTLVITERDVSGSSGCNRYTAAIGRDETTVSVGTIASTDMMCAEEVVAQENAYLELLAAVTRFELDDRELRLFTEDTELRFSARTDVSDAASDVVISSANELEVEALNTVLAQNPSASWAQNPLLIALTLLRFPDAAEVTVSRIDDAVEGATGSVVTITEERLLDDSVAGRLLRVSFVREDGRWRVDSVQEAFRCARGDNTRVFTAGPCP
jgi:heat shock protein HslJ